MLVKHFTAKLHPEITCTLHKFSQVFVKTTIQLTCIFTMFVEHESWLLVSFEVFHAGAGECTVPETVSLCL